MTKPLTFDGQTHREMTDAEFTQYQTDIAQQQSLEEKRALQIAARASALSKLAALGLTDAEIKALVG